MRPLFVDNDDYLPRNFTRVRVLLARERVRIVDLDFGAPVNAVTSRVVR